jgi:hypothetical protein
MNNIDIISGLLLHKSCNSSFDIRSFNLSDVISYETLCLSCDDLYRKSSCFMGNFVMIILPLARYARALTV